jgi:hypothetical protein
MGVRGRSFVGMDRAITENSLSPRRGRWNHVAFPKPGARNGGEAVDFSKY